MSGIDERIVSMKFNNSQFETGVQKTLSSLASLKAGLNLDASRKSLEGLNDAGKSFSLAGVSTGVESISSKFVALATIGITALANITSAAIATGTQLVKSLTVDPIRQGLTEYETNLNAIQTILSNTQSKGTNLDDVNGALAELNAYSDQTIYNFSEMARNIGTFTAAGVDLNTSTNAIKGIANLAAVSGSNAQQASSAMYQLSQAMSTGTVKLQDWNSVVNSGMGGQVFQDSLKETARAHGVAIDQIVEDEGSFRDSLQTGWLSTDILTETLSKFTGDLSADQLKSMGYTDDQITEILKLGTTAKDAATKVKTMSQLIGTLQEAVGSGWAQTWQLVFGDFEEAKTLFTGVNDVIGGMISASAASRNALLTGWKELGGRTAVIDAIKNAFDALMAVVKPIKDAFTEIFPPSTAQQLYQLSLTLKDFTAGLIISSDTADKVKRIFKGLFAAFDIAKSVVVGLVGAFVQFFKNVTKGHGDLLEFVAGIGDFVVKMRDSLETGGGFIKFFSGLNAVLAKPVEWVRSLGTWIGKLFSNYDSSSAGGFSNSLKTIGERLSPLEALSNAVVYAWKHLGDIISSVWNTLSPIASKIGNMFGGLGARIAEAFAGINYDTALDTINTGLFAGLLLLVKKFVDDGLSLDVGGGMLSNISSSFEQLTNTLSAMQTSLKADTLFKIAAAIGILTLSMVALSLIDSAGLTRALTAMAVMFTQLMASMAMLDKISSSKGFVKMPVIAGAMILLSVAVLILTAAVKNLSDLSWEELSKGLAGVAALLGTLVGTAKLLSASGKGLISAGLGMIAVAVAIKILASAVSDFAGMDWASMAQGLAGVAGALLALGLFAKLSEMGKMGLANSAGIVLIAIALKIFASAVGDFAQFSWEELGKGMAAIAAGLGIVAGAMALMSGALPGAISLVIVAGSLLVLADVLKTMASMSWEDFGKSMAVLAGGLLIIAAAMYLMEAAIPGALALVVVAGALAILAPVLLAFASMSWEDFGKSMAVLAGALAIIGIAGALITPVVPGLIGLGIAVALIGIGAMAAGIGVLALSVGLTALGVAAPVLVVAIVAIVSAIISLIPMAMEALANGIIAFAAVIANSGPTLVSAMVTLITSLLTAIDTVAPQIVDTLFNLIMLLVDVLSTNIPIFAEKGAAMIAGILNGIAKNMDNIVAAAINVITSFMDGIARGLPKLVQSGINLIITFVESLADGIRENTDRMNDAGTDLASAIVSGMVNGISGGLSKVVNAAKDLATGALNAAKKLLGINSPSKEFFEVGGFSTEGLANGLNRTARVAISAASNVGASTINALRASMSDVASVVSSDIDMTPSIRPVLDLSAIKKDSSLISSLLATSEITPTASTSSASSIATEAARAASVTTDTVAANNQNGTSMHFTQINQSPKALTAAEIYRQTNNLLSVAKGALPTNAN